MAITGIQGLAYIRLNLSTNEVKIDIKRVSTYLAFSNREKMSNFVVAYRSNFQPVDQAKCHERDVADCGDDRQRRKDLPPHTHGAEFCFTGLLKNKKLF